MKKILTTMVFMALCSLPVRAETIQLKSNHTIEGKIIEQNDSYIRVDIGVDKPLTFYPDEIEKIVSKEQSQQPPAAAAEKHFLWKVSSSGAVVYLFGSIHFGKADMYPLAPVIEEAFRQSSALVVEVNMEGLDPLEAQQTMLEKGSYPPGNFLKDQVSSQTFKRIERRLAQFSLPLESVAQFKPWLMAITLTVLEIKLLGFDENYGVDHYFSQKAMRDGKEILQFESLEEQINFLDSLDDQNKFLDYTLISLDETEEMFAQIRQAWQDGDAAEMEKIAITDQFEKYPDTREMLDILLFNRNQGMTDQIKGFLDSPKTYFVVVGSAHLVGEEGIVELLRKEGLEVEQL